MNKPRSKSMDISLSITTFLMGLFGGIGFFVMLGGNPALIELSEQNFAEYWQRVDHYMGARMPVVGPLMLLSLLVTTLLFLRQWRSPAFWLLAFALLLVLIDLVFTLNVNRPLNQLIQSWDLKALPSNVKDIQQQVYEAFNVRMILMIGSFFLVVAASFFYYGSRK